MKPPRRALDAVLLLDKPSGLSSYTALQAARRRFSAAKAGHGGTLDPLASGLLPVLFGEATKFSAGLLEGTKAYRATVRLGTRTDTADAEGRKLSERPVAVDRAGLDAALAAFRGEIEQVPPMHSALKRAGQPLYKLARRGIEVERAPRRVRIDRLELVERNGNDLMLDVSCSKGTYIRSLADDLGERLGCGAHLAALRRTAVAGFEVAQAWTLERLDALPDAELDRALMPPDALVAGLPEARLDPHAEERFRHGQPVRIPGGSPGARRVYTAAEPAGFLGLGELAGDGWLRPVRLLATNAQAADNHRKTLSRPAP